MPEDNKHTEYLITKFRQLGTSTTKWALLFLLAITYTWYVSIYSQRKLIQSSIIIYNKHVYLDSLIKLPQKLKDNYIIDYRIKKSEYNDISNKVKNKPTDTVKNEKKQAKQRLDRLSSIYEKLALSPQEWKDLRHAIDSAATLKGGKKKYLLNKLKTRYQGINILIVYDEKQSEILDNRRNSLKKAKIIFNVPGMNTANFEFTDGLICWMVLNLFLLLYVYSTRLTMIRCLKEIYTAKAKLIKSAEEWKQLDLQVPTWITPIIYNGADGKAIINNLTGWRYLSFNNVLGLSAFLLVIGLQFHVAWLAYHVSIILSNEIQWFDVINAGLIAITVFLLLLWIQPLIITPDFADEHHFSFERREMVKLSVSALFFLLLISPIKKKVSLIDGNKLHYTRYRKRKKQYKVNIADGFYIHKTSGKKVIYYFLKGISPSMKSIDETAMKKILPKLQKIDMDKVVTDKDNYSQYKMPYHISILEREAYTAISKNNYLYAIKMLLFGLHFTIQENPKTTTNSNNKKIADRIEGKQMRISILSAGLIIRAQKMLSQADLQLLNAVQIQAKEVYDEIYDGKFDPYTYNKGSIVKKWKNVEKLPWCLP